MSIEATEARKPGRPSNAERAARQDIREPVHAALREAPTGATRSRKGNVDKFELPESVIMRFKEAGWSLEWKRHTVVGQPDPSYEVALAENAWENVMADEIPGFMPKGMGGAIIRDGLQLMKRPLYLTQEARMEDANLAIDSIRRQEAKLGQTPPGQLTRDHPTARPKVGKSYEPIAVPKD